MQTSVHLILLASVIPEDKDLLAFFYCFVHKREQKRYERWPHGAYLTVRSSLRGLIFDMLKIAQAALIGLHGVQFWCPHVRSYLRKPVCAGKFAVKFARVDGPLFTRDIMTVTAPSSMHQV